MLCPVHFEMQIHNNNISNNNNRDWRDRERERPPLMLFQLIDSGPFFGLRLCGVRVRRSFPSSSFVFHRFFFFFLLFFSHLNIYFLYVLIYFNGLIVHHHHHHRSFVAAPTQSAQLPPKTPPPSCTQILAGTHTHTNSFAFDNGLSFFFLLLLARASKRTNERKKNCRIWISCKEIRARARSLARCI